MLSNDSFQMTGLDDYYLLLISLRFIYINFHDVTTKEFSVARSRKDWNGIPI